MLLYDYIYIYTYIYMYTGPYDILNPGALLLGQAQGARAGAQSIQTAQLEGRARHAHLGIGRRGLGDDVICDTVI